MAVLSFHRLRASRQRLLGGKGTPRVGSDYFLQLRHHVCGHPLVQAVAETHKAWFIVPGVWSAPEKKYNWHWLTVTKAAQDSPTDSGEASPGDQGKEEIVQSGLASPAPVLQPHD